MFPFAVLITAILFVSCGSSENPSGQDRLHHPDVNVNIHREVPEEVQNRMWPDWFDRSLFPEHSDTLELSENEWDERLSYREYRVLRNEGTETPFVNEYHTEDGEGVFVCRACSAPLFSSEAKFHSSSGWPSYFAPIELSFIGVKPDHGLLSERTEVHCARCGSHIGHVFEDGPQPTGLRYCMNSLAMRFIDRQAHEKIAAGDEEALDFVLHR